MSALNVILSVVLIIAALFMIVTVLLQSSSSKGLGAMAGQSSSDSYFSKNKTKSAEAKLALGTKVAAVVFVVLSLLMVVIK